MTALDGGKGCGDVSAEGECKLSHVSVTRSLSAPGTGPGLEGGGDIA